MKKVTKFFMAALLAGMCCLGYAQTKYEWEEPTKPTEKEIAKINISVDGGRATSYWDINDNFIEKNKLINYTKEQLYEKIKSSAQTNYGNTYPRFALRNFKYVLDSQDWYPPTGTIGSGFINTYKVSASVVIEDHKKLVSSAMNKALRNVPEGSRLAIDRISSDNEEIDRETLKDQVIDMLLDKGYKIVAKDYLAKLYQEQQDQQSGIYNENTTVRENNFSAVGYYLNVKVSETSVRVQVVNVSTGEYEGNATVNF